MALTEGFRMYISLVILFVHDIFPLLSTGVNSIAKGEKNGKYF
jgi:hypothetical protein